MGTYNDNDQVQTLMDKLTKPISPLIQLCKNYRVCKTLPDEKWIEIGLYRTFSNESTGRGFLQKLIDNGKALFCRSHFFETLKSERRLKLCQEISFLLFRKLRQKKYCPDPLSQFKELNDFDIYAGDGHYHSAAAHDIKKDDKKYPTQHFYSMDLRTGGLNHLTLADTSGKKKREHDMRALKRLTADTLRQGSPVGRKVLYVWDRAGIDFRQWFNWKYSAGIYFISREKKNMDLLLMGNLPYDPNAKINKGVESFQMAGTSTGVMTHQIKYKCPLSGKKFTFITNLINVPPGLIAYLYKTRWDIEKIFDEVKNKLKEKKAWATSDTAKNMQAQFICLAHNLMLIFDEQLRKEGIDDQVENKRRKKRLEEALSKPEVRKKDLPIFLKKTKKPSQLPVKFIRWISNNMFSGTSWRDNLMHLKLVYDTF